VVIRKTYDTIKDTTVAPWTGAWLATLPGATNANVPRLLTPASNSQGLVWGKDTTPLSSDWIKPALNQPYIDPAYGATIRCVSETNGERFNRNKYSRIQNENADGSYFFTYYGNARYRVYKRETLEFIRELNIHPDSELQWHPSDPNKIRHLNGANTEQDSLKLYETDVATGRTGVIADLTDQIRAIFPAATEMYDSDEGSPSKEGNRYAWMIGDINGNLLGFVTYDLSTHSILGSLGNIPENIGEVDWVSVSPSGEYMIASSADKYNRDVVTNEGTYVFKVDFSDYTNFTSANLIFNAAEHSDIGIAKDGNDMYIYINFDSNSEDAGWIMGYNLKTKSYSHLVNIWDDGANTSMHISAKGFNKPGWAVISTYGGVEGAWTYRKVYALELVDNGRIANLAHTYNCADTYFQETQAVVNRDFSRVYFNSTSNQCGYIEDEFHTEVYSIDVPAF